MAERSFAKEVESLRLGEGETFVGEGILAITKALLQSGVGYVGGYQGAPISHLMDVLADAQDILGELGVRYEASASEAAAAATLAASVHYPIRGAVAFKSTVGTNVASDALANLASGGVTGGALIVTGEDYGEGSSIMQERSHAFAMKSQIWLLDPRPDLPSIVDMVEHGFALSEASNTPVMLEVRIRCCHVHGRFTAKDNRPPPMTVREALEAPRRDLSRIVLPPASFAHEKEKVERRLPAALDYVREHGLNERFGDPASRVGIVCQGGMFNGVMRALARLGLADEWGETGLDIYCLNVTYPLVPDEVLGFCEGKDAVLVVEEGQPDFLEQAIGSTLFKARRDVALSGKDVLPMAGELTGQVMLDGVRVFLAAHAADLLAPEHRAPNAPPVPDDLADLAKHVPGRPPGFCIGCPERPIFAATKLVEEELGPHHIASDIGCHLFSIMPPFDLGATTMGYGLGPASASALNAPGARPTARRGSEAGREERADGSPHGGPPRSSAGTGANGVASDGGAMRDGAAPRTNGIARRDRVAEAGSNGASRRSEGGKDAHPRRSISFLGDGGFWHNGLTSSIGNAVFNEHDGVIVVVDNHYSAATGGQDILSSRAWNRSKSTNHPIVEACRGVGVRWVREVPRTYDVGAVRAVLREALTTPEGGPKVIVASSECMLNRQRREKPLKAKALAAGERVVRTRFGVDEDVCTGDHACIRLSGCPSLTVRETGDPLRDDPVAHIDEGCVGCGNCGEVADAAILCPSFYQAEAVSNPRPWERRLAAWRRGLTGALMRRRERGRLQMAAG